MLKHDATRLSSLIPATGLRPYPHPPLRGTFSRREKVNRLNASYTRH